MTKVFVICFLCFLSVSAQNDGTCSIKSSLCTEERTLIIVKPDGVQRGLVGEVLKRYEAKGLKLIAIKMIRVSVKNLLRIDSVSHDFSFCSRRVNEWKFIMMTKKNYHIFKRFWIT